MKPNLFLFSRLSIALLLSSILFLACAKKTPQALFADYYDDSDLPEASTSGNAGNLLSEGIVQLKNAKFDDAETLFRAYKETSNDTSLTVNFYMAATKLKQGEHATAHGYYDYIIDFSEQKEDESRARWFKALTFLKEGDAASAETVLKAIAKDPKSFNHGKAEKLLEDL